MVQTLLPLSQRDPLLYPKKKEEGKTIKNGLQILRGKDPIQDQKRI